MKNNIRTRVAEFLIRLSNRIKPHDGSYWFGDKVKAMQVYGDTLVVATEHELYQSVGDGKFTLLRKENEKTEETK